MAYMSQEKKKQIHAALKVALKPYNLKWSLSINNHSTIVLTIREGDVNFFADLTSEKNNYRSNESYLDINPYWYHTHFTGKSLEILTAAMNCLNDGNHDRSDMMTDYFDVGWYVSIRIGKWDKPYNLI